jgi:hypothetical protein
MPQEQCCQLLTELIGRKSGHGRKNMDFPEIREDKRNKKTFQMFGPFLSRYFFLPLFIRSLLSYAAEHSASWQHFLCRKTKEEAVE